MNTFWQDLRYGLRMMRRSPGFTAVAVLSLALGIGANTAIFTLLDKLLVRALPVEDPERLVTFVAGREQNSNDTVSYPFYTDLRDRNQVFSGLIAYNPRMVFSLSDGDRTERVFGQIVSGNYFSVLGVDAALGRTFLAEEDRTPGTHPVVVLSHGLWHRRFGADPRLVGRDIKLNGLSFTVVGIAPAEFTGVARGTTPEIYVPVMMQREAQPGRESKLESRNDGWLHLMGRLKPGIGREQARVHLTALAGEIKGLYPRTVDPKQLALADGSQGNTDRIRELSRPVIVLMVAVGFVLLIACANVANLLLERGSARRKEIAVRLAVGARRMHVVRQLLTESVLLSLLGGSAGLLIATWLADFLASFQPPSSIPLTLDSRLDPRILGFALLLSFVTGVVFGLAPAFRASKPDLVSTLKDETVLAGRSSRRWTLRNLLVVFQVALSLVVLINAALCIRSLQELHRIDTGFEPAKVLVMSMDLSLSGYDESRGKKLFPQLVDRISALAGVENTSLAFTVPLGDFVFTRSVAIESYQPQPGERLSFYYSAVGPRYFQTMGISVLRGREFTAQDTEGAPRVAIINEQVARRYFSGQDPVGKRLRIGRGFSEIVGITRDSKYRTLTEDPRPTVYLPLLQNYTSLVSLHVRATGDPAALVAAVRSELQSIDSNLPIYNVKTLAEQISSSLYRERMVAALLTGFGLLTLLLAAVGLYGVMAFAINQRTREIGIRMALGARHQDVLTLVVHEGMTLVALGLVVGLGAAIAATRLLSGFLYGVSATDPWIFLGAGTILATVALAANLIPALRAAKVDPIVALRYE